VSVLEYCAAHLQPFLASCSLCGIVLLLHVKCRACHLHTVDKQCCQVLHTGDLWSLEAPHRCSCFNCTLLDCTLAIYIPAAATTPFSDRIGCSACCHNTSIASLNRAPPLAALAAHPAHVTPPY
jgi:hypothetical protein